MNRLYLPQFNIHTTLLGGQSFAWDYTDGTYFGSSGAKVLKLKKLGDYLLWQTYPVKDDYDFFASYLRLDFDYDTVINTIKTKDKHIAASIEYAPGLRLLKQNLNQTIISFIISANSNIAKIRKSTRLLSQLYNNKLELDNRSIFLFPSLEFIAQLSEHDLRSTGIGYRAKYVKKSAEILHKKDYTDIANYDYYKAKEFLLTLPGIGNKVADCILVFALAHDTVTPLDLWAQRALVSMYNLDPKMKYQDMMAWLSNYYGSHTSWAGQFLFEYIRKNYKQFLNQNNSIK